MIYNLNSFTQKGSSKNNLILIISIVLIFIFFICIMPTIEKCYNNESKKLIEKIENVMINTFDTKKCSRSCCINTGWALPKELQSNDISPDELKNYVSNNFSCSLGSNIGSSGGCLCLTKDDYELLGSRGNNGVVGYDN